jgi:hypothetical protein
MNNIKNKIRDQIGDLIQIEIHFRVKKNDHTVWTRVSDLVAHRVGWEIETPVEDEVADQAGRLKLWHRAWD